jgi:hypothetical protein
MLHTAEKFAGSVKKSKDVFVHVGVGMGVGEHRRMDSGVEMEFNPSLASPIFVKMRRNGTK